MVVDHIDRDRLNNKLENLRIVTRSENQMNIEHSGHKRFPNASHITKDKRFNTWLVRVKFRGSYVIHKNFPSIEEAQIARDDAVQKREEMLRCG